MPELNKHLQKIKVEGFKSIKSLDLDMQPINILIGANGAGKSNFISLFTFLRHLSEGRLDSYVQKNGYGSSFFHFGPKSTKKITIDLLVNPTRYTAEFEHNPHDDSLIGKVRTHYDVKDDDEERENDAEVREPSAGVQELNLVKNYMGGIDTMYLNECRVYHFHDSGPTALFKQASSLEDNDYLYSDAGNIAAFLFRLKNNRAKEYQQAYLDIIDAIQTVAPYFHDFYLKPTGPEGEQRILLKWIHKDYDTPFSANQLSDGTARFICMATLFLQPYVLRPETILLDEPELGLHPAALEVLAEIVKATSKENQVICSTQSVTFANQFEAKDFIVVDQEEGASVFNRVDEEQLKAWLEDYAMGDIWTKNLIGGRPAW